MPAHAQTEGKTTPHNRLLLSDNVHMPLTDDDKNWIERQLKIEIGSLEIKIERVETGLKDQIERVETNLLTAFHQWASPMEMRQRSHSAAIAALDQEIEALKERVKKLESPAA